MNETNHNLLTGGIEMARDLRVTTHISLVPSLIELAREVLGQLTKWRAISETRDEMARDLNPLIE